jgi:hypothetical protein
LSDIDKENIAIYSDGTLESFRVLKSDGSIGSDGKIKSDGRINSDGRIKSDGTINSDGSVEWDGTLEVLENYITSAGELVVRVQGDYGNAVMAEQGNLSDGIKELEKYLGDDYKDFLTTANIDVSGLITTFTAYTTSTDLDVLRTQVGLINGELTEIKTAYDKYLEDTKVNTDPDKGNSDPATFLTIENYFKLEKIVLNCLSETLTEEEKILFDINKDNVINVFDLAVFKKKMIGVVG